MSGGSNVLVVDDDPAVRRAVGGLLRDEGYRVEEADSAARAFAALCGDRPPPAAVVLDIRMPGETGLQLMARLPRPLPAPVIVLSGEASAGEAVEALRLGATDFVEKPPTAERLLTALKNALQLSELQLERERLVAALARPGNLVGEGSAMRQLRQTVAQVARSDALVLIQGETGAGKERVARALHEASGRRGRLVAVNCAAIPSNLLESELFGHERGAFSGATARHLGKFEQAQGGTLLLDEIGDMPLELQSKLLRVLEAREVERLGGTAPVKLDVRVLAATHQDLPSRVKDGRFRQDLYFRLSVFPLRVPPLRERAEDVLPLARAFAAELRGPGTALEVEPEAQAALEKHPWPGNVRELRNFVERVALLRREGPLRIGEAEVRLLDSAAAPPSTGTPALGERSYRELVEEFERSVLKAALAQCDGNVAAAARLLKVDRGNLFRRIRALGVEADDG
ncbi:MAG TPA: sigma-54 dependent transcriptional regulator [Myxococcales bacterium]|nr:sigma-54 dependent transcriptional regulator [Myxococcales bacterium]